MAIQFIFVISDQEEALRELCFGAKALGAQVTAVMFGDNAAAERSAACGADRLFYCPSDELPPEAYAKSIAQEIRKVPGALVLLNNSIRGRCLAGKIGVYLDTAVLTNVSALAEEDGRLVFTRTVYGGAAVQREAFATSYSVITAASGLFGEVEVEEAQAPAAAISLLSGSPQEGLRCIARNEKKEGGTNLAAAKRIVDVGRGLAAEEDLELMRTLASVLEAEVGCSRPVAENNKWLPKANYMGITGVVVKPDLCMSIGVSGQVQHIAGIDKSKVIVAVNKDKNAPIFKHADFGVVGNLYKVIPALIEKLSS
ncbi:MAG: electron transfer flavoprotein subunit alpha/FixB family protein [Clostridia bacterium]|nr:electron transfer flavoprotein subunit alpha/FixB family protein [Clostridia bacterium]